MTLSKSGMDSDFSSTNWWKCARSQSTSGIWAILSDSLGFTEVKKSVMTCWEQLTGLFANITRSRMRDLNAIFAVPISLSCSAVPRCVICCRDGGWGVKTVGCFWTRGCPGLSAVLLENLTPSRGGCRMMLALKGSRCGGYLGGGGHKVIGSSGAPQGVSAGDHGCGCRPCRPASCLCVGCRSDAQIEDDVHDPWQGRRFGYHVTCRD